jgi:DNA-binding IclR family transcriptional regulator
VAGNSTDAGRSVTSKVTAILLVFADDGAHTLTEIAGSAHLPTSTAHRLASELVAWRLLERTEERHYRIGLPLRIIASEYSESEVCSTTQTVMRALPMLDDLSRATRSEVRLGVLRGSQVLTLRPQSQRVTGRMHAAGLQHGLLPAHAAAAGKVLLAFSSPAVVNRVIAAGLPAFTPHTITSPDVLRRKLSVIRLTQIATSRNELECGKAAIAMPIFYGGGRVAAAIELAVRDLSTELKPAASALSVACHSLSRQLATEFRVTGHRDGHGDPQARGSGVNLPVLDQPAILGRARGGLSPDQAKDCLARHRRR